MSSFTRPLFLTPDPHPVRTYWVTSRELTYEIGMKGSGLVVTVPERTRTDLATVPRFLWPIIPPHDPGLAAAFVLHDYLCRVSGFSRVMADAILYDALRVLGASLFQSWLVYAAVSAWRIIRRK
jgi:hypothetical protein